jgi:hypothetical protein
MMELTLDQQDIYRILACLAHTAKRFEDEATRRQAVAPALLAHPLGLLGILINSALAEMFGDEAQQLRTLRARLTAATGLNISPESAGSPFASM